LTKDYTGIDGEENALKSENLKKDIKNGQIYDIMSEHRYKTDIDGNLINDKKTINGKGKTDDSKRKQVKGYSDVNFKDEIKNNMKQILREKSIEGMTIFQDVLFYNLISNDTDEIEIQKNNADLDFIPRLLRYCISEFKQLNMNDRNALSEIVAIGSISIKSKLNNRESSKEGKTLFQELWEALMVNIQKDSVPDPLTLRALPIILSMVAHDTNKV